MGSCFSSKIKTDSPLHNVSVPSTPRTEGVVIMSSVSVPSTPRTEGVVFLSPTLKSFSFNELKTATGNFRPGNSLTAGLMGEGHFASVFKGGVNGNSLTAANPGTEMVVAVKRFNGKSDWSHLKWLNELNYARRLHHPNLVKLIGYCSEDDERLLVYEFMPRGSLDDHLFKRSSHLQPLSWTVRMKIALGAAKVLAFFHSDEANVIYRNFQISNILLDSDYNAKLCSLRLATRTDINSSSRKFKGTRGYAAPEYLAAGHLSAKCDVYGFGVVMLEMMTGRRVLDCNRPNEQRNLVKWAEPYLADKRKFHQIIDVRLEGTYPAKAWGEAAIVLRCLSRDPKSRPSMNDVVETLEKIQESRDMGGPRPSQNEPRQNPHAISSNGPKHRRRSVDGTNNSTTATHSRPSAHSNT